MPRHNNKLLNYYDRKKCLIIGQNKNFKAYQHFILHVELDIYHNITNAELDVDITSQIRHLCSPLTKVEVRKK